MNMLHPIPQRWLKQLYDHFKRIHQFDPHLQAELAKDYIQKYHGEINITVNGYQIEFESPEHETYFLMRYSS